MVDATIYDIASKTLLFRAPGVDFIKSKATPVNLTEQLRQDRSTGFNRASENLLTNLTAELDSFSEKVKNAPTEYEVVSRAGYSGGGSSDYLLLFAMAVLLVYRTYAQVFESSNT